MDLAIAIKSLLILLYKEKRVYMQQLVSQNCIQWAGGILSPGISQCISILRGILTLYRADDDRGIG